MPEYVQYVHDKVIKYPISVVSNQNMIKLNAWVTFTEKTKIMNVNEFTVNAN
jgi:hypothetical protein